MAGYIRVWVDVLAMHAADGTITPVEITWSDGRRFKIDKAIPKKKMRTEKTLGPDAFRYECTIGGRTRLLYEIDGAFFVEVRIPSDPEERVALETSWRTGPKAEKIGK